METERNIKVLQENREEKIKNDIFIGKKRSLNEEERNKKALEYQIESYLNENYKDICKNIFSLVVYESLLVDEEIKRKDVSYINEKANEFFDHIFDNKLFLVTEGSIYEEICSNVHQKISEKIYLNEQFDDVVIVKEVLNDMDMDKAYLTGNIKFKEAACVQNEKKIVSLKEELSSEGIDNNADKTLFRKIFEEKVKEVISETSCNNTDAIENAALAEALLDYCLIETANTLQIIEFDNISFKRDLKYM